MDHFSSGKLLITGEYLILKGALALASPVKFGQSIHIHEDSNSSYLIWESYERQNCWFTAKIDTIDSKVIEANDPQTADRLLTWLKAADQLNPGFLKRQSNKKVIIKADFDRSWGLGSSSSLLSNIAWWAEVDPFPLNRLVSKGSGYDVVCARENGPIFFNLDSEGFSVRPAEFNPVFKNNIYFIYLGQKQDSSKSVASFLESGSRYSDEIERISALAKQIAFASNLSEFEECLKEHEEIMADVLRQKRIKEKRFADLKGEIKSLGAWGGDFAMLTWHDSKEDLKNYLTRINIDTIFTFDEIIRTR
jgi:mevalonate kinase